MTDAMVTLQCGTADPALCSVHFGPPRCSVTIKPLLFQVTGSVWKALGVFLWEIEFF
jgi:hypothetical protein